MRPDLFIVGRAETEDATHQAEARRRRPRHLAVPDRRRADRADRAAAGGRRLHGAGDELRQPGAGDGADHHRARARRWPNRSILEANLRQRYGVIVVGIQREDSRMEFNPEPDTAIRAGDKLVVLGPAGVAEAARDRRGARQALMAARVLDGTAVANADSRRGRRRPSRRSPRAPGGRPASASCWSATIRRRRSTCGNKLKSAGEAGLRADLERLPATATLAELLAVVDRLNRSDAHDGILVQSPLPAAMGERRRAAGVRRDPARRRTSTACTR